MQAGIRDRFELLTQLIEDYLINEWLKKKRSSIIFQPSSWQIFRTIFFRELENTTLINYIILFSILLYMCINLLKKCSLFSDVKLFWQDSQAITHPSFL